MPRKYTPADAIKLMRSSSVIQFATDVARNPAFARADARTVDAHGRRVAEYVRTSAERELWPQRILRLVSLPLSEFEAAMADEPVRRSSVPKPDGAAREIVVPTFVRRCVSNIINEVLALTGDHLLPMSVRAYRPRREAVREAVLDVAESVHNGSIRFFAKLDFKSYFTSIPWSAVEGGLRHYGYGEDFIAYVLVLARCTMVERRAGRIIEVPVSRGAQQGLPESATLANLVPFALDDQLASIPGLVFIRYSDDIFIGSKNQATVVAAVRAVAAWCRGHDLQLKGVSPKTKLSKLVKDVKREKVSLLGAEIDGTGYVHMPAAKMTEKLSQLQDRFDRLELEEVRGTSRYGNGGGAELFDEEDLRCAMEGFVDSWSGLDPRATTKVQDIFKKRFPVTPAPSGSGRGTLWTALLWRGQRESEAGTSLTIRSPTESPESDSSTSMRSAPSGRGAGRTTGGGKMPKRVLIPSTDDEGARGVFHSDDFESEPEPFSRSRMDAVEPSVDYEAAGGTEQSVLMDEDPFYTEVAMGLSFLQDEEVASLLDADGRSSYRFVSRPATCGDAASSDSGSGASPPAPSFENTGLTLYVDAVRLTGGQHPTVCVGVQAFVAGLAVGHPSLRLLKGRVETAVVRTMLRMLPASGPTGVTFAMNGTWLAKALLQPSRRFRAPILYSLVVDLHERARDSGFDVSVIGGVEIPPSLSRSLSAAAEARDRVVTA